MARRKKGYTLLSKGPASVEILGKRSGYTLLATAPSSVELPKPRRTVPVVRPVVTWQDYAGYGAPRGSRTRGRG
jgi:hypothetical protein